MRLVPLRILQLGCRVCSAIVLVNFVGSSASAQELDDFSWGYSPVSDHWYASTSDFTGDASPAEWEIPWQTAQEIAASVGGNLATIRTVDEEDWIIDYWYASYFSQEVWTNQFWVGLNDVAVNSTFEWVSGEAVTYSRRIEGNPNTGEGVRVRHSGTPPPNLSVLDWVVTGTELPGLIEINFDPYLDSDSGGVPDAFEDQNHDGLVQSWELDPSDPTDDDFALLVRNLNPGERPVVRVFQATPGASVWVLYSLTGSGPTDIGTGFNLDLTAPVVQALNAVVPVSGNLILTGSRVPNGLSHGVPVWIQALEMSWDNGVQYDKSNLVVLPIGSN